MDIISQLQEQVNLIASLAFNTYGTLQRDAPPVRLSPNYPEPTNPNPDPNPNPNLQQPPQEAQQQQTQDDFAEEAKKASAALVKAAKQFDALVNALPLAEGGEKAQLKRIAELQAENDMIGQELQRQLEAAGKHLGHFSVHSV